MQAVSFMQYGGPEVLGVVDVEVPTPGPNEVRIRVSAASVNPFDWKVRRGDMAEHIPLDFPARTGMDASGTIVELGSDVHGVAVGDKVFGTGPSTFAEEAILDSWALVPSDVLVEETAGWGVAIATAVRILNQLEVDAGATMFISGASGGVGTALTQLAVARGISVVGSASRSNQDYVASLGAVSVTYGEGLQERVSRVAPHGVQAAVDLAGSGIIPDLVKLTGDPSRVLSIADYSAPEYGATFSDGDVSSDPQAAFAEAIAIDGFRMPIHRTFSLADAGAAQALSAAGHPAGKILVKP